MKLAHSRAIALGVFVVGTASVAGACLMSSTDGPATRHTAATGSGATMPKATLGPSKERTATKDVRGAATVAPAARSLALETGTAPRAGAPSSSDHGHAALAGGAEESSAAASPVAALASRRDLTPEQREKLAAALGKVDWNQALKDLVAAVKAARAQGQNPDPDTFVEGAEIHLALAEAAKALGLKGPGQALADPNVRSVVVPAWLGALGVDLDPTQSAAVAAKCLDVPSPNAVQASTFLEARQAALQSRIALEQSFGQVLTPDQLATYATNVVNDPLMKAGAAQMNLSAGTPQRLMSVVASYWTTQFQLDGPSQEAAKTVASQYVQAVLAVPPVAPNLDPEAARLANLNRTSQLVALQQQAEQSLASNASLSQAQQTRAAGGSRSCLRIGVTH